MLLPADPVAPGLSGTEEHISVFAACWTCSVQAAGDPYQPVAALGPVPFLSPRASQSLTTLRSKPLAVRLQLEPLAGVLAAPPSRSRTSPWLDSTLPTTSGCVNRGNRLPMPPRYSLIPIALTAISNPASANLVEAALACSQSSPPILQSSRLRKLWRTSNLPIPFPFPHHPIAPGAHGAVLGRPHPISRRSPSGPRRLPRWQGSHGAPLGACTSSCPAGG